MSTPIARQLSRVLNRVLATSGTPGWNRRTGATIFCYHNVVPDGIAGRIGDTTLHLAMSAFAEQMAWVARAYTVVSFDELIGRLHSGRPVGRLAVLTFDDGYAGAVRHAVPIMRSFGLPFTIFPIVADATEQRPFWWDVAGKLKHADWERNVTGLQGDRTRIGLSRNGNGCMPADMLPASWDMLRAVREDDCTIGVHGVSHRNLATLSADEILLELTQARERIHEELGVTPSIVAYPYGRANERVAAVAAGAGFVAGTGSRFGLVRPSAMPYDLARVDVPQGITLAAFMCWASGLKLRG